MGLVTMKCIVLLSLCALSLAKPQSRQVTETEGRIIGGEEAPKHEFPWQVSLKSFGSHICGGSVVNKMQVITAAHCCEGQLAALDSIVAGAHNRNLEPGHQNRAIARMEYHENWNTPDFDHDICIITLKEPLNLDDPNVAPIEFFQTGDADVPAETICNSTGWGLTTCNGDSGGPLVCPDENGVGKLTGIVSFGYTGCTDAGVYAKVSQFTDWIMERWVD